MRAVLSVFFHRIFIVIHMKLVLIVAPSLHGLEKLSESRLGPSSAAIEVQEPEVSTLQWHILFKSI